MPLNSFSGNLATVTLATCDSTPSTSLTLAQTNHLVRLHSLFAFLPYVTLFHALGVVLGVQTRYSAQKLIAGYVGLPILTNKRDSTLDATNGNSSLDKLPSDISGLTTGHPQKEGAKSFDQAQPCKPQHVVFIEVDRRSDGFNEESVIREDGVLAFSSSSLRAAQSVTPRTKIKFSGNLLPSLLAESNASSIASSLAAAPYKSQPVLVPIPDPSGRAPFILVPLLNEGGHF